MIFLFLGSSLAHLEPKLQLFEVDDHGDAGNDDLSHHHLLKFKHLGQGHLDVLTLWDSLAQRESQLSELLLKIFNQSKRHVLTVEALSIFWVFFRNFETIPVTHWSSKRMRQMVRVKAKAPMTRNDLDAIWSSSTTWWVVTRDVGDKLFPGKRWRCRSTSQCSSGKWIHKAMRGWRV